MGPPGPPGPPADLSNLIAGPGITLDLDPGPPETITISSTAMAVTVGDTPPAAPQDGDLWFDSDTLRMYIWYEDPGGTGQWVGITMSSSAGVTISAVPPASPTPGTLWFDPNLLSMYVWLVGPTGSFWVGVK